MLSLAFDTATRWGRFALAEDDHLLAYQPLNVSGSFADSILPVIEQLLEQVDRSLSDLETIGITRGPGSFTGVRIGVATAKGLAYGLGTRLIAVSTLAAMAAALLRDNPAAETAVPVLDARRRELFAGVYRRRGPWVEEVVAPAAAGADQWWQRITEVVDDPDAAAWGGDGVSLLVGQGAQLRPELSRRGTPHRRSWSSTHPATARALAVALAGGALATAEISPFALTPLYLRGSDAEVKKKVDLTPQQPSDQFTSQSTRRDTPESRS